MCQCPLHQVVSNCYFSPVWSQPVEKSVHVCMCTPTFWFIDLWDTGPRPRTFEPARLKTRPYSWLDQHMQSFHTEAGGQCLPWYTGWQVFSQLFSSVRLLSRVRLFVTPWTAAYQASLSITNSQSLLKLMSIASVKPSNNLILCHPLLLPPSLFPSITVFSNESVLCIKWPEY